MRHHANQYRLAHQLRRADAAIPGTDKVVEGLHCRVLVVAKSGSRDWRDRWHRLCRSLGLSWDSVQDQQHGEKHCWETIYDVWGAPEALGELTCGAHKVVVRWEYGMTPTSVAGEQYKRR